MNTRDFSGQSCLINNNEDVRFTPFLKLIADDIYEQYGNDLSNVTIIVPNKRASLFFNQYLSKHIKDEPIWSPRFTSIGEVFEMLCPLKVADPIQQICKLYEAYRNISNTDESLDKFYSWAELMKNDFDDIDNNLANAEMLFKNIEELEEMNDFSFLSDNQKKAIRQYFDSFNYGADSELKSRFMGVWKYLYDTYVEYRKILSDNGLCYSGMQKRYVVEGIINNEIDLNTRLNQGVYVIIGFNVLNETEKNLFKFIKQTRTTLFYWDYDEKYLHTEAGRFITENIKLFGNRFANHPEYYQHFGKQKSVKFVKSPTENAQARYVHKWIDKKITNYPLQESVVVLCNEDMLQPVLHSIPKNAEEKHIDLNITMGYPLQDTPIYSFILSLMQLQMFGIKSSGWRYAYAASVLKHPYTKRMVGSDVINILSCLKDKNIIFPNTNEVTSAPLKRDGKYIEVDGEIQRGEPVSFLTDIFTPVEGQLALVEYLMRIVKSIGESYKKQLKEMKSSKKEDFEIQLYVESIFNTYTTLSRLHTIQEKEAVFNVNNSTLSRVIIQILQNISIPFHGEPVVGLQIMGLLETRNLDFRNVLMLSANDNQLPKKDRSASLIPYVLREAYGMTTIEKQTSLYAFYFYNLLQRTDNITLMYNSSTEGTNTGEMSRFMMQLQIENEKVFGCQNKIELISLSAPYESQIVRDVVIQKTNDVRERLKSITKISPTAINTYIDCPLKFYLARIAGFKQDNEVTEDIDSPMFGNIFHRAMEFIYRPLKDRLLVKKNIEDILNNTKYLEDIIDRAFGIEFFKKNYKLASIKQRYNGVQLLNKYVITDYVKNQLKYDALSCPMIVRGVEDPIETEIVISDDEKKCSERQIIKLKIGGIIDRWEIVKNQYNDDVIRITDYKTNAKAQKANSIDEIFIPGKNRPYNYLQSLYYCEVFSRAKEHNKAIMPALMYIKSSPNNRDSRLSIGKEFVEDYEKQVQSDYIQSLNKTLADIFLSDKPFTQNKIHCDYCEFKNLCNK